MVATKTVCLLAAFRIRVAKPPDFSNFHRIFNFIYVFFSRKTIHWQRHVWLERILLISRLLKVKTISANEHDSWTLKSAKENLLILKFSIWPCTLDGNKKRIRNHWKAYVKSSFQIIKKNTSNFVNSTICLCNWKTVWVLYQ